MPLRNSIFLILSLSASACKNTNGLIENFSVITQEVTEEITEFNTPKDKNTPRSVRLSSSSEIKQLQKLLTNKGYNTKGIDGIIGPSTIKAIKKYQKENGLTVDGQATNTLLKYVAQNTKTRPSNALLSKGNVKEDKSGVEECFSSNDKRAQAFIQNLLKNTMDKYHVDIDSYLKGLCVPENEEQLAKLYIFLVTEGVIHSRVAEIKYNQLLAVYKKAGVVVAFNKDAYERSTGTLLIKDIEISARDRMDGADKLVKNSYQPDDNADFQKRIKNAYEDIPENSQYKNEARHLLSEVLVHSSSSTFYLVRSAFTIDKLSDYFGINLHDGVNMWEKSILFIRQVSKNMDLAFFLLSKQSDIFSMLSSSTYNITSLTQDIKDIPRLEPEVATKEVRSFKEQGGFTLDEMELGFDKNNKPRNVS